MYIVLFGRGSSMSYKSENKIALTMEPTRIKDLREKPKQGNILHFTSPTPPPSTDTFVSLRTIFCTQKKVEYMEKDQINSTGFSLFRCFTSQSFSRIIMDGQHCTLSLVTCQAGSCVVHLAILPVQNCSLSC